MNQTPSPAPQNPPEFAGSPVSRRQQRVIHAILASPTLDEACKRAKVNRSTVTFWKRGQPAFRAALKAAEDAVFNEALQDVRQAATEAARALQRLLTDKSSAVVLRAAQTLLQIGLDAKDRDFEERLIALEAKLLGPSGFKAVKR